MNKTTIGLNAGTVWGILSNNVRWTYEELKLVSGLNDVELGAALGWLAREDKIEIEKESEDVILFLSVNVYIG